MEPNWPEWRVTLRDLSTDAPYPPAALINAVPGLVFGDIVKAIEREGLFLPP
jgi:hypothetical protein